MFYTDDNVFKKGLLAVKTNQTKRYILKHLRIYSENGMIENGFVLTNGETIEACGSMSELPEAAQTAEPLTFPENFKVLPGMIDVHIHGANGADVMDGTPEALNTMAEALPKEGTTSFLATTMTQDAASIEQALANVKRYMESDIRPGTAEVLGIHLEGPFISEKRCGAQPPDAIIPPDLSLFKAWQELSGNHIKQVTIAPELEGSLELISYLNKTGVVASAGHSDAGLKEMEAGIEAGLSHVTHLFNGMRGLHHREPGVAGSALLHRELIAELIADGIHVHPAVMKLAFRQKQKEGIILITDAMRAKCLKNGTYTLGGQEVFVKDEKAVLQNGTLAGSILKMDQAARNMMEFSECTLEDIVHMTAVNPAKQLQIFDRKGSIKNGKDADLIVLNEKSEVVMTLCKGVIAFNKREV
ncbi:MULTISPECIES: N-acetylglucosamine-6-phosphate deacetylase [Bacillus]|uniref:N-acetylglucosamine-6-phosphate deacetylase n=1 Tax=Bacillus TaxID=1386 RepID=UPI00098A894D|nr:MULTISPECIES: N-acetylglucosamine-6-phosphate deacetylase [Bacillus]QHZ44925.1 N-acetylglucosamine-6-phosphate deacetylase [Bacillus sp. NSP9.1]WFA05295.1 N-acetylglucosamine-6-phosphate deacetylase [Bacillus sp. HSf4]